jgi:Protein of unknown function (DUF2917)
MCSTATRIRLDRGQSTVLPANRPAHLASAQGTVWVTIDHDPRDIVLEAGDAMDLWSDAPVVVSTLGGPAVLELTATSQPATESETGPVTEPVSAW